MTSIWQLLRWRASRFLHPPRPRRPIQIWSIGIYAGPSLFELTAAPGVANPVLTYHDVSDVRARFVADPFMLGVGGAWHMFFEVMNEATKKGEIGLAVSGDGRRWQYQQIVLAEPFHLSYPYAFEWEGEHYMVPESRETGILRLYRAHDFPRGWTLVDTVMEARELADASMLHAHDRWWMFVKTGPRLTHDTLRLYYASALTGPWQEHPSSPIVTGDPRIARPAGRLVRDGDRIYRFAQDCEARYGVAVRAFEILALTPETYQERPAGGDPMLAGSGSGWTAGGMHHVDAHPLDDGSWIACVDGWVWGVPHQEIHEEWET